MITRRTFLFAPLGLAFAQNSNESCVQGFTSCTTFASRRPEAFFKAGNATTQAIRWGL